MAKHDLTGSLERDFTFNIDDKEFKFRKPTVREMRAIAKVFSGIESEKDPDVQLEKSDQAMESLYKHITPIDHDSNIADVINDQPVDVQVRFNKMIQEELGASS